MSHQGEWCGWTCVVSHQGEWCGWMCVVPSGVCKVYYYVDVATLERRFLTLWLQREADEEHDG